MSYACCVKLSGDNLNLHVKFPLSDQIWAIISYCLEKLHGIYLLSCIIKSSNLSMTIFEIQWALSVSKELEELISYYSVIISNTLAILDLNHVSDIILPEAVEKC